MAYRISATIWGLAGNDCGVISLFGQAQKRSIKGYQGCTSLFGEGEQVTVADPSRCPPARRTAAWIGEMPRRDVEGSG